MSNTEQQFDWAQKWNSYPTRCVNMTQNAYECVITLLEEELQHNQSRVRRMMGERAGKIEYLQGEIERGVKIKLTLQELKRIGDIL